MSKIDCTTNKVPVGLDRNFENMLSKQEASRTHVLDGMFRTFRSPSSWDPDLVARQLNSLHEKVGVTDTQPIHRKVGTEAFHEAPIVCVDETQCFHNGLEGEHHDVGM